MDVEYQVELDKTSSLFRNSGIGVAVTAINGGFLVFILGGVSPPAWALIWWLAMLAVSFWRYGVARSFAAANVPTLQAIGTWRTRATLGALLAGVTWGTGCAAMMVADAQTARMFAVLISGGMIAGALALLSSVQSAFRAYALPIVLAIVATAVVDAHGQNDWIVAFASVMFIAVLLRGSRDFHDSMDRSTRFALLMKRLAGRLENSEQLFRTLAESTNAAIFTYRETFEYVNPAGERLCGYSLEELRRIPFWSIVHPDDRAAVLERGSKRIDGEDAYSEFEYRILTKNGETRWVDFHGAMVMIDGLPTGLGSAFDITSRKQAKALLIEMAEKLRDSERREMRNMERERLMEDMHDGFGSSLIATLNAVQRGKLNSSDIAEILRDCIDDLRLTLDSLDPVDADLVQLLGMLRYRLEPRLESAQIELNWGVADVPALDWLDPRSALQILRIVQEAFANVAKHAKATKITLKVYAEGERIAVTVEDNGCGFDVVAALVGGGRGLASQRHRAAAIGADIQWLSRSNGSTVKLLLPISKVVSQGLSAAAIGL
jgi:PAS domain S-box-containing protein